MAVIGAAVCGDDGDECDSLVKEVQTAEPLSKAIIAYRMRYVLALVWLIVLQYGTIGPAATYISTSFFAGSDCEPKPDSAPCKKGAAELAYWRGLSAGASHSVAWLAAVALGSWSDSVGRRPLFISKSAMSLLPSAALFLHVWVGLTLWAYLVIIPMYEAFDTNGVFLAVMSDVITETHSRATAYGVLITGVVLGVAIVLPLAALLPEGAAVIVSMVAAVVKLVFVCTAFPETAPSAAKGSRPFNPVALARDIAEVFCRRNSCIARMALVLLLTGLTGTGLQAIAVPILTGYIGMTRATMTLLGACCAASALLSMLGLLGPLVRSVGEVGSLRVCLGAAVAYPPLFAACTRPSHVMLLSGLLVGPMSLLFPVISSIKSNLVAEDEQGLVQGALAAVRVAAVAAADLFFGWLFQHATQGGSAPRSATMLPLATVTGLAVAALAIACSLPPVLPPPPPPRRAAALARGSSLELSGLGS